MALFESYERREKQILAKLAEYGINSIEEAAEVTKAAGLDVYKMIEGIQPICFENAKWAYTVGAAIAIKKGCTKAADAAAAIGEGLQSFCIPGSVADQRKVGLGHGNLGKMLLEEETETAPEAELEELLQKNPEICIVTNELGYGVVPIEPFDRKWREKTGRICTELAAKADSVTRVVCGIGILLKGEEKHD